MTLRLRVPSAVKRAVLPVAEAGGVLHALRHLDRRATRVCLAYHNVAPATFRQHAEYLRRHATVVGIHDFIDDGAEPSTGVATLTFDDGYASFAEDIVPILREFGFPAAWFVPTALVGSDEIFWFDRVRLAIESTPRDRVELAGRTWPIAGWNHAYVAAAVTAFIKRAPRTSHAQLVDSVVGQLGEPPAGALETCRIASREQIRTARHASVTVGSHSHTHPQLSQLDADELVTELTVSKRLLEAWTGAAVDHFAFPSGDYDRRVLDAIARAGYVAAWTTEPRHGSRSDPRHALPRVSIDDHASTAVLSARMTRMLAGG